MQSLESHLSLFILTFTILHGNSIWKLKIPAVENGNSIWKLKIPGVEN